MLLTKTLSGCDIVGKNDDWVGDDTGRLKLFWDGLGRVCRLVSPENVEGGFRKNEEEDPP